MSFPLAPALNFVLNYSKSFNLHCYTDASLYRIYTAIFSVFFLYIHHFASSWSYLGHVTPVQSWWLFSFCSHVCCFSCLCMQRSSERQTFVSELISGPNHAKNRPSCCHNVNLLPRVSVSPGQPGSNLTMDWWTKYDPNMQHLKKPIIMYISLRLKNSVTKWHEHLLLAVSFLLISFCVTAPISVANVSINKKRLCCEPCRLVYLLPTFNYFLSALKVSNVVSHFY